MILLVIFLSVLVLFFFFSCRLVSGQKFRIYKFMCSIQWTCLRSTFIDLMQFLLFWSFLHELCLIVIVSHISWDVRDLRTIGELRRYFGIWEYWRQWNCNCLLVYWYFLCTCSGLFCNRNRTLYPMVPWKNYELCSISGLSFWLRKARLHCWPQRHQNTILHNK